MYLGQLNYNVVFYEADQYGNRKDGGKTWRLLLLESVQIHKSVDLLAATCTIKLPDAAYNEVFKIKGESVTNVIRRGFKVVVALGCNQSLRQEFSGYVLSIGTDSGSITINCENSLFLLRKPVKDKQWAAVSTKTLAQYIIAQTGVTMNLNCTDPIMWDKFTAVQSTGYDMLYKLQESTKDNIFIAENADGTRTLHIHPPYEMKGGEQTFYLQGNVESSDLKYQHKEDLKVQIVIKSVGTDGKVTEFKYGTEGGDQHTREVSGLSGNALKQVAQNEYNSWVYDGYQGSIDTWLFVPVEPTFSANIIDDDYPEKNGTYYVMSVTTEFGAGGGKRKVQIGKKLGDITNGQLQAISQ